jgi:hypothetical protein
VTTARLGPPLGGPTTRDRGRLRLLAAVGGLAAAGAILWWSGSAIPAPPSLDPGALTDWASRTDPVVVAVAAVRAVGLALVAWVAVTGAAATVVHATRLRRRRALRRLLDRACLPVVRRLVHGATGTALVAAVALPVAAAAQPAPVLAPDRVVATASPFGAAEVAVIVALPAGADTGAARTSTDNPSPGGEDVAVLRALDRPTPTPPPVAPIPTSPSVPTSTSPGPAEAPPVPEPPGPERTWTIEPGDHLWGVAEATLERLGLPSDDGAVARYLHLVVEANRDRLVVPDDPDLVVAGQVFVLPAPPAP